MSNKIKQKWLFTPGPLSTSKKTKEAMLVDLGSREKDFIKLNQLVCKNLIKIASAKNYICVPMQGSGTFGIEAALLSVLKKNSKILIISNGEYGRRIANICKKISKKYYLLSFKEDETYSLDRCENFIKKNKQITHIAMIHCETSSGILNPLADIGNLCKKYKKKLFVDAMSTFGGIQIDFKKNNIDTLVSSVNKCLEGVPGFSFVIIKKKSLINCSGNANSLSLDIYDQWKHFLKNGQWRFTPPTHSVLALSSSLKLLSKEGGVIKRYNRYKKNYETLINGMEKIGFTSFINKKFHSPIIVSFNYPRNKKFNFDFFYKKLLFSGYVIYPGMLTKKKTFRIGCIGNINSLVIKSLLKKIKETLLIMRIKSL